MFTKEIMEGFTELDFAVYDCIVKNEGRIGGMTIRELADMAHVSTATVLRFCKKSGADGYRTVCPGGETNSAVLVLSVLGSGGELVSLMNSYKKAGASLISVTNTGQCLAARMSDINFSCYMPEIFGLLKTGSTGFVSQLPTVYLLELLTAEMQKYL